MDKLPVIGITMGDPAGIGPEIIAKAIIQYDISMFCRPLVIGDKGVIEDIMSLCNLQGKIREIEDIDAIHSAEQETGVIEILNLKNMNRDSLKYGIPDRTCGIAAVAYIEKAVELACEKKIDAMTTAPINKEIINAAGYRFPGHTEMLAKLAGVDYSAMMMVGGGLRVILVTIHVALKDVPGSIKKDKVLRIIRIAHSSMRYFNISTPRIGVAALNPHAGEGKLFGSEEWDEIMPAVLEARGEGIEVSDPLPGDTIFYKAREGYYDVVVAMYHDQGLIPVKVLSFGRSVNVTLGLPFIRTSVDHGTAYDIAGKNCADPRSLIEAIKLAVEMTGGENGKK